ncbi:hypothetical protein Bhyg_16764 [Pseudolycoriella hygida]|uniref:Uncharacterized protein n=1 Tax=Pseudolycoriella hygida TaxID=35572 RepID=A0A9Q0MJ00_9DIPT|nr:hypothetical protein Bhyg_16764 [Pseudolycoriella hygida]
MIKKLKPYLKTIDRDPVCCGYQTGKHTKWIVAVETIQNKYLRNDEPEQINGNKELFYSFNVLMISTIC